MNVVRWLWTALLVVLMILAASWSGSVLVGVVAVIAGWILFELVSSWIVRF
jgi:hypothetical protein